MIELIEEGMASTMLVGEHNVKYAFEKKHSTASPGTFLVLTPAQPSNN